MRSPILLCLFAGIALYFISALWIVILAFRRNFWFGCGCFFLPILQLVYVITNWRDSHWAFYVHLAGYALILAAAGMAYATGQIHPISQ